MLALIERTWNTRRVDKEELIAVVGLGYVGLPVACAFGQRRPTLGFDISESRIKALEAQVDINGEHDASELRAPQLRFSHDPADLAAAQIFIVTVPTPLTDDRQPDLGPLCSATKLIAERMQPGALVIYESTVYPGVTEEVCQPLLAELSGLRPGVDFHLGYSPERINPGDRKHTLQSVVKVVSGDSPAVLERVAGLYEEIVDAGVHRAPSIKVAEAAKVIENTQRDLNVALMNELAIIFDKLGIATQEVLAAANTKWNFLPFSPGLVGGHCIGVDPYYLTARAQRAGCHPEMILAGRRLNDRMGAFIARKAMKLAAERRAEGPLRATVYGATFKENVSDTRNSRVPDIVHELRNFGVTVSVCDPNADPEQCRRSYGIELVGVEDLASAHVLVLAVPHRQIAEDREQLAAKLLPGGVVIDVKGATQKADWPAESQYWAL